MAPGCRPVPSVRWRKVLRDLGVARTRTVLVVLSIAVGVFAVGTIAGASTLLQSGLREQYLASKPASATISATPFGPELVDAVRQVPGVADAEARRSVTVRLRTGPQTYRELQLTAISDFKDQRLDLVTPEPDATWPPPRGAMLLERSSLTLADVPTGGEVQVLTGDGKLHTLRVAGLSHEVGASPAFYVGRLQGHISFDTLAQLGYGSAFDEMRILARDPTLTQAQVRSLAETVRQRMEDAGVSVIYVFVPPPGQHPANNLLAGVFLVLGFLGLLALLASGFLVVNTVNAIIAQQTRQIGVMKAVGARNRQIAVLYLGMVLVYAVLALGVALPLGALGAFGLTAFTAHLVNFDVTGFFAPPGVVALEVAVGLLVPLLAALVPVWRGVRVTVREAVSSTGIADVFGRSRLDRALQRVRGLSRPTLLSLRNTFRRKSRLALTLSALTLGGAVFMAVFTVRASLYRTLDDALAYFDYDVQVELAAPARADLLEREAMRVPGVVSAEAWRFATTQRIRSDGSESRSFITFGLPTTTTMVRPKIQEGRWLLPDDGNALVATANVRSDEPDLRVGDRLTMRVNGRDATWTLVGIVESPTQRPFLYANAGPLEQAARDVGRASLVMLRTAPRDAATEDRVGTAAADHLRSVGVQVSATTTIAEVRTTQERLFEVLVIFMSTMALLLGVVGGLGLAGTMSINVVERAREIGVIRAVGASDGAVLRLFLAEGLMIGLMSWALGAVLAIPISRTLSDALGLVFLSRPLSYAVSADGVVLWLGIVLVLSAAASLFPAWRASRLAVREVLAYE
jgi:putative ABC transport system permease protein